MQEKGGEENRSSQDQAKLMIKSNLTLHELMTLGDPMALADTKHSALSDLARIANQLDGHAAGSAVLKEAAKLCKMQIQQQQQHKACPQEQKSSGQDRVQITLVSKPHTECSGESSSAGSRPSVIQKNVDKARAAVVKTAASGGEPPAAHSQRAVTSLPKSLNPATELCQYYAQMLSGESAANAATSGPAAAVAAAGGKALAAATQSLLLQDSAVGLSLTLSAITSRPPTPAAATPSIFVPCRRIFPDPALDVRRNRTPTTSAGAPPAPAIQAAHTSKPVTAPPAPPPSSSCSAKRQSTISPLRTLNHSSRPTPPLPPPAPALRPAHPADLIPLVDLTCGGGGGRGSGNSGSKERRVQQNSTTSSCSSSTSSSGSSTADSGGGAANNKCLLDLSTASRTAAAATPVGVGPGAWPGNSKSARPLLPDVSISVNVKIEGTDKTPAAAPAVAPAAALNRHSVTVMPIVANKEESSRLRLTNKECSKDRVSVTPALQQQQQQQQQHQHQQQHSYPRMVDSLVGQVPGAVPVNGAKMAGPASKVSSVGKSATEAAAASSSAAMFNPHLLDPALASYYSLYSPHMYNLPSGSPFLASPASVFGPHLGSSAAAEVTAQVYKDLVQRGYPPALAPGLPPLGALGNLPALNSLGSYASLYSSLAAKEATNAAANAERSVPKS